MCMRKPHGKGLELARKHVALCLSELSYMSKSLEFLRSLPYGSFQDDIESSTTASGCKPIGFDASLNSTLSAPGPPRATHILSWKKVRILTPYESSCFCHSIQVQKPVY